jgi:hypothetical protein
MPVLGETMEPTRIADERDSDEATRGEPRSAPAPGVPVSAEELERLKAKAKTARLPPSEHRQEDPSGKKQK